MFLKSTANEFRLAHEMISCNTLKEDFVEGVKTQLFFKKLFSRARQSAPSMIILDDIDEITSRDSLKHLKVRKAVYQLLRELDRIKPGDRLLITATSDRPFIIEPLLFKARRFDKLIFVPMPNADSREELFNLYLQDVSYDEDINLKSLGRITSGYNGADIERIINYAIRLAEKGSGTVTQNHLERAAKAIKPSLSSISLDPIKKFFMRYKSGTLLRRDVRPPTMKSYAPSGVEHWEENMKKSKAEPEYEVEFELDEAEEEEPEKKEEEAVELSWDDEEDKEAEDDEDEEQVEDTEEYEIEFDEDSEPENEDEDESEVEEWD
jgi:hypothetical protein